jgi:hypothetical protein
MFRPRTAVPPDERPELHLSPFQRRRLAGSWVLPFRDHILPLIDEHAFAQFFHARHGAPNRSITLVVAILLLKDFFDFTDEEALDHFAFDRRWHIALDVLDKDVSCCQKTLHNFRALLRQHDKARQLFEELTDHLVDLLDLDTQRQRLDSTHCKSNFASLRRLGIFCETIRLFLRRLQRHYLSDYANLPEQLRLRYHSDKGGKSRYQGAAAEVRRRRLAVVTRDLFRLIQLFEKHKEIASWPEFAALQRILAEQCEVLPEPQQPLPDEDDRDLGPVPVRIREPKSVPSNSLQTPHDPDATYGKKGQGYEVQVCETFGNHSEDDPDKPELITHVEVTPSCQSDNRVTVPIIKNLKARDVQPTELEVDSNFTNSVVIKQAQQLGTAVIGPVMGSKDLPSPDEVTVGDFRVDLEEPSNSRCPAGHPLSKQTVQEPTVQQLAPEGKEQQADPPMRRISLAVLATVCLSCAQASKCPAKAGKGEYEGERVVKTTEDDLICAQRRRYQTTPEFKERYAWRAGAEATNSELKRAHGIGKLAVRGQERVKVAVYLKALACNVKRVAVYLGKLTLGSKGKAADQPSPAAEADSPKGRRGAVRPPALALDC